MKTIVTLWSLAFLILSCANPADQGANKRGDKSDDDYGDEVDAELEDQEVEYRRDKISAYQLDDAKFLVTKISLNTKDFMKSESPYLAYNRPKDADYVEILLCSADTILETGVEARRLADIELSGLSETEKNHLYRTNDYFTSASENDSCEISHTGTAELEFIDSFSDEILNNSNFILHVNSIKLSYSKRFCSR